MEIPITISNATVINEKTVKLNYKLIKLYFAGTVFVEVHSAELVFVGIVFVSFIISTHITTGSPILLSHLPFS